MKELGGQDAATPVVGQAAPTATQGEPPVDVAKMGQRTGAESGHGGEGTQAVASVTQPMSLQNLKEKWNLKRKNGFMLGVAAL